MTPRNARWRRRATELLPEGLAAVAVLILVLAALVLSACGGVGQDGTGAVPDSQSTGVVNGFGSVIVDGVHHEVGGAEITIDGEPGRRETELRVGMVVTVTGTLSADGSSGVASRIRYDSLLNGQIDEAPGSQGFRVLGQRVQVEQTTVFTGAADANDLRLGDRVQVSGFHAPDGSLRATWIQRETGSAAPRLTGFIGALGPNSVQVYGLQIDITNARLVGVTPATLAPGQLVRLVLQAPPAGGAAVATQLSLIDLKLPDTVRKRQIQGIVDDWDAGSGRFTLVRQPVRIDAGTQFVDGSLADLANGARVEVSGSLGLDLVLKADRVRIYGPLLSAYARASITSIDVAGRRLQVLDTPGLQVRLRPFTLLHDTSGAGDRLTLSKLAAGDEVLVIGRESSNGIDADYLQRLPRLTPGAGIGGPVSRIAGFTLTILDVTVNTGALGSYFDAQGQAQTQAAFFAALRPGDLVRAEGAYLNGALAALVVRRVR